MPEHSDELRDGPLRHLALYNYGNYTSMRVVNGAVRGLQLHLDRLARDSAVLFGHSVDPEEVLSEIRQAVPPGPADVVVRVTVYADDFVMQRPVDATHLRVLTTTRPTPPPVMTPISLATAHYERELPTVKHVGLFGQLWHRRAAQIAGRDDVVFVDASGRVLEGATWNVGFIRRDGRLVWPDSEALPGVTQALVSAAYDDRNPGGSLTRVVSLADLVDYPSIFITNAVTGVRAVSLVDDQEYLCGTRTLDDLEAWYAEIPLDSV